MNAFSNYYSPMNAFFGGFEMGDKMDQAAIREAERVRALKERDALAQMGQGNHFAGFEGVEGATRPDYLKQLYQDNPEAAWKVEQAVAQPFAVDRDIYKQGKIERAKREADAEVGTNMMNAYFKARGGGQGEPQGASAVPASMTDGEAVQTGGAMPAPNLSSLSGDEPSFEMTPQGFKFGVKSASPLDQAIKVSDVNIRKADQELNKKKYDLDVEKQIIDKAKAADQFDTSQFNQIDALHKQENDLKKQIDELKKQKSSGDISPADYLDSANRILGDLKGIQAQKEALLRGRTPAQDTLGMSKDQYRNPSSTEPQAIAPKTSGTIESPASAGVTTKKAQATSSQPQKSSSGMASIGAGLPYKQQVAEQQKYAEEQRSISNAAIKDAHAEAAKISVHQPRIKRMLEMVDKGIGNRFGKLPGGETALEMTDQNYNEFSAHRNALIDILMKEGGSQLMNTLPELAIHSDAFPKISDAPDVNRRKMVDVANLAEARLAAPKFLEDWSKSHGRSIEGAQTEFRLWKAYNDKYEAKDVHGQVKIVPNAGYIPLDKWAREREAGTLKIINGQVLRKQ